MIILPLVINADAVANMSAIATRKYRENMITIDMRENNGIVQIRLNKVLQLIEDVSVENSFTFGVI